MLPGRHDIATPCQPELHGYDSHVARSHEALWLGVSATLAAGVAALVTANVTFDSVRPHYRFWTDGLMIAAYAVGSLALACFAGAMRGWEMPLAGAHPHRGSPMPSEVDFFALSGLKLPFGQEIERSWKKAETFPRTLETTLGIGQDGRPIVLDLINDGPSGLITGDSGTGTTETLRTILLGLALKYPLIAVGRSN